MSQAMPPDYPNDFRMMNPPPAPAPKRTGAWTVVALVALILAIVVILNETMLKISKVAVIGNDTVPWEDVIRAAGLDRPVSYFSVDEKKIAQGVQSNHLLIFERLEKQFPNGLTLYVRERKPVVLVQEMGAEYVLDEEGMVLSRRGKGEESQDSLMIVTGLKPKDLQVGRVMTAGSSRHTEAYKALVQEVLLQGILSQVSELNMTDPDSLYLITVDGYTAHLGDTSQLRAKIGTARAVVAYLRQEGMTGGMLEVSIPGEAVYTPGGN